MLDPPSQGALHGGFNSLRVKPCVTVTKQLDFKDINSISLLLRVFFSPRSSLPDNLFDPHGTPVVAVLYMTHRSGRSHVPECCCFLVNLLNGL